MQQVAESWTVRSRGAQSAEHAQRGRARCVMGKPACGARLWLKMVCAAPTRRCAASLFSPSSPSCV